MTDMSPTIIEDWLLHNHPQLSPSHLLLQQ